jgi:hypothetical protein
MPFDFSRDTIIVQRGCPSGSAIDDILCRSLLNDREDICLIAGQGCRQTFSNSVLRSLLMPTVARVVCAMSKVTDKI